jgi:5-methylcytosine-specific restriction endonuclease McrA
VESSLPARSDEEPSAESPAPARIETVPPPASKPLVPHRYRVEFTASQEYVDLLEEARNLMQHRIPDREVARVHELAMALFVEYLRKRRQGAAAPPGRRVTSDEPAPQRASEATAVSEPAPERVTTRGAHRAVARKSATSRGRYVPAALRREVWQRDGGRCTFADASGRRCSERAGLEIHHDHAFALGGVSTLENLRLLCRSHNALYAERDFGREHMERSRHGPEPLR